MAELTKKLLASMIDHTILKADATGKDVLRICAEAKEYGFGAVCINPVHVPGAAAALRGSGVKVCTVIGFPLGASAPAAKAAEARLAVEQGADELDMVIDIGAAKSHDFDAVERDIRAVVEASGSAEVKVIIETCYLTDEEKREACECVVRAGAEFVKTSTGTASAGATVADVRLMREAVGGRAKIKAAGGIRDLATARAMIDAGADRIGASAGIAILAELG